MSRISELFEMSREMYRKVRYKYPLIKCKDKINRSTRKNGEICNFLMLS